MNFEIVEKPVKVTFYRHREYKNLYVMEEDGKLEITYDIKVAIFNPCKDKTFFDIRDESTAPFFIQEIRIPIKEENGEEGYYLKRKKIFCFNFEEVTLVEES